MSIKPRNSQERTARLEASDRGRVRDHTIVLGTDTDDCTHIYRTTDETIHVIRPDGTRVHRECLIDGYGPDEWMAYVADRRGWDDRQYGQGLVAIVAEALD